MSSVVKSEKYTYRNLPIPGGGYVTGFLFHENEPGIQYLRTDIGGAYRLDREPSWKWESLINHVTMEDLRETYPIALALDERDTEKLYILSGVWGQKAAKLSISKDRGEHFEGVDLPFRAHGNLNGRGTGQKLIVDHQDSSRLFYASQQDGLWKSEDGGYTWVKIEAMVENYLTFVAQSPDGNSLMVGSAGVTCEEAVVHPTSANAEMFSLESNQVTKHTMRGPALYLSTDGGESFEPMWQPENIFLEEVVFPGYVAERYSFDDRYFYVTFSYMGPNAKNREMGYSCDNGSLFGGHLIRYQLDQLPLYAVATAQSCQGEDISPDARKLLGKDVAIGDNPMDSGGTFGGKDRLIAEKKLPMLPYGLIGVATGKQTPGLVVVSSVSKEDGDCLFRSLDYGDSWEIILYDLSVGVMDFRTEYMKPPYNGGHNLIHWMTDVKINPFDSNELWFTTGTGPFVTHNLLAQEVHFSDYADGVEETVHLNLYSPTKGDVKLIDIVGDLGGFAFTDLDKPCDNSFADADGNRYITCINADCSDLHPEVVVVTPRGNWTGMTKGGLILTKDQCKTFERLPMPFGLSEKIDELLTLIERPNVNSGWVAMSPDCQNIVWSIGDRIYLPADCVVTSNDGGVTFAKAKIYDLAGDCISDKKVPMANQILPKMRLWSHNSFGDDMPEDAYAMKVYSDRVNSDVFYGFGMHGEVYLSADGGRSFVQKKICLMDDCKTDACTDGANCLDSLKTEQQGASNCIAEDLVGTEVDSLLDVNFSLIDTINGTEVRGECGKEGILYMALEKAGLWKLQIHFDEMGDIEEIGAFDGVKAMVSNAVIEARRLGNKGDCFFRLGLGVGRPGGDYYRESKALYVSAIIDGEYGFFRSVDDGDTFVRLNESNQMYGEVNSMEGDSQEYGRFYIATGSRGVLYGEPTDS